MKTLNPFIIIIIFSSNTAFSQKVNKIACSSLDKDFIEFPDEGHRFLKKLDLLS